MKIVSCEIEEYEDGAWVANMVSLDSFTGSFTIDGTKWTGTAVSTRQEFERYHTTIVGGKNGLAKVIEDKFYSGNVSLTSALSDACRESGETVGSAPATLFLQAYERLRGPAYQALDALATAFGLMWWIDRDGLVQLKAARDTGTTATGQRVSGYSDSVVLANPGSLTVGCTYDGKTVRHVRWLYNAAQTTAEVYFVPFVFRPPVDKRYSSLDTARVDKDRGDGTIDVIVAGRYGMTKVPLYCGVPGSKVKVNGGEIVQVGYFGGDPQKPFACLMAQDITATKNVGRVTDEVTVSLSAANITALAALLVCTAPTNPPTSIPGVVANIKGTITAGSARLQVGD